MLITVRERTHEFGIRKALGAKPWSILRTVILESIVITSFFGYLGLVLGVAATEYLNYWSGNQTVSLGGQKITVFLDPTVDLSIAFEAVLVLIIAGMLAGLFPARKAVRVKPIEALRAE
jgi:putative ABC transport system permease protein